MTRGYIKTIYQKFRMEFQSFRSSDRVHAHWMDTYVRTTCVFEFQLERRKKVFPCLAR